MIMLISAIYMLVNVVMIATDGYGVIGTLYNAVSDVRGGRPVSGGMAFNEFLLGAVVLVISYVSVVFK